MDADRAASDGAGSLEASASMLKCPEPGAAIDLDAGVPLPQSRRNVPTGPPPEGTLGHLARLAALTTRGSRTRGMRMLAKASYPPSCTCLMNISDMVLASLAGSCVRVEGQCVEVGGRHPCIVSAA